jgi:hypothetical protein
VEDRCELGLVDVEPAREHVTCREHRDVTLAAAVAERDLELLRGTSVRILEREVLGELLTELAVASRELADAFIHPRADGRLATRCCLETECNEDSTHGVVVTPPRSGRGAALHAGG